MAVDVQISEVVARVSATDPELLNSPALVRRIVQLVKAELEQERDVEQRRAMDRKGLSQSGRGR